LKIKLVQQAAGEEEDFLLGQGFAQAFSSPDSKGHHSGVGDKFALAIQETSGFKLLWVGKVLGIKVNLGQDRHNQCLLGNVISPKCGVCSRKMVNCKQKWNLITMFLKQM
jgi:hypothetical protein